MIQRVDRDEGCDEAAGDGADRPKAHGGRTPELGTEVSDERRGGHENRTLDDAEQADHDEIRPLAVSEGNADGRDEPDDEHPVNDDVRPTYPVCLAGRQARRTHREGWRRPRWR